MPLILLLTIAVLFLILKRNSAKIKGAAGEAKVNAVLTAGKTALSLSKKARLPIMNSLDIY